MTLNSQNKSDSNLITNAWCEKYHQQDPDLSSSFWASLSTMKNSHWKMWCYISERVFPDSSFLCLSGAEMVHREAENVSCTWIIKHMWRHSVVPAAQKQSTTSTWQTSTLDGGNSFTRFSLMSKKNRRQILWYFFPQHSLMWCSTLVSFGLKRSLNWMMFNLQDVTGKRSFLAGMTEDESHKKIGLQLLSISLNMPAFLKKFFPPTNSTSCCC